MRQPFSPLKHLKNLKMLYLRLPLISGEDGRRGKYALTQNSTVSIHSKPAANPINLPSISYQSLINLSNPPNSKLLTLNSKLSSAVSARRAENLKLICADCPD